MFRQCIYETLMTSQIANTYFSGKITGDSYQGDFTFLATLRALLYQRQTGHHQVQVLFNRANLKKEIIDQYFGTINIINTIGTVYGSNNGYINIVDINCFGEEGDKRMFESIEDAFSKIDKLNKFKKIEKFTDFFRKNFYSLCYVNEETEIVNIFVEHLNLQRMHYIQCAAFVFLPWFFNLEEGVTADEMELIKSLREKTPDDYVKCIEKFAKKIDFREEFIRASLKGFEVIYERKALEQAKNELDDVAYRINSIEQQLYDEILRKRNINAKILGLEMKINNGETEDDLMEYFLHNKKLHLSSANNDYLVFIVKDYIQFFDEEMAKQMIDKDSSYIYTVCRDQDSVKRDDVRKLMTAIFLDQELKIRTCAAYSIKIGGRVKGMLDYSFGVDFDDCIPNPHIDRYQCLGDYVRAIEQCIQDNNYVAAVEQCCASAKSLNFADSIVMKEFLYWLFCKSSVHNNRCIELPDGSVVRPMEAIEYLKNREAGNES